MTAMMLGSAYAGGVYYFSGLLMTRQWHRIKVGLLPVTTFASVLSITTILHWDKFNHGTLPFFAWSALYFTTPFIVFGLWLRNREQDTNQPDENDATIPQTLRFAIGAVGATTLAIAIFLFLNPTLMIQLWPWTLTPLTSRVMAAMFSLPGIVGLGLATDPRWSSAQIILQSQGFSIFLILIAVVRTRTELDWSVLGSWLFTIGLAGMLIGIIVFHAYFKAQEKINS
jgi:Ca2+/Na+ antiporter